MVPARTAQSAVEYLITYGWAILIILVAVSFLYYYVLQPTLLAPGSCSFQSQISCRDIVLAANTATSAANIILILTNTQPYPIKNAMLFANINGTNTSAVRCTPGYVPAGGAMLCQLGFTRTLNLNSFVSGKLYINAFNCGFGANYTAIASCATPVNETYSGLFSAHAQIVSPSTALTLSLTSSNNGGTAGTNSVVTLYATVKLLNTPLGAAPVNFTESPDIPVINPQYATTSSTGVAVSTIKSTTPISVTVTASSFSATNSISIVFASTTTTTLLYSTTLASSTSLTTILLFTSVSSTSLSTTTTTTTISYLYVSNYGNSTASQVNMSTDAITGTVAHLDSPTGISLSPNEAYAYVANANNTVSIFNTSTGTIIATITGFHSPYGVSFSPTSPYAYVTNYGNGTVSIVQATTTPTLGTIPHFSYPYGVSIAPNGAYAYVANGNNNTVSIVNTSSRSITGTITGTTSPYGVSFSPNGAYAYVVSYNNNEVYLVNTSSKSITSTITGFHSPSGVSITPNGLYAYVANDGNSTVSVINTSTGQIESPITGTITGFHAPYGVSIAPNGAYAYATNFQNSTVSIVNTSSRSITGTITGFSSPYGVSIAPNGAYAYVTNGTLLVNSGREYCFTYSGKCYIRYYYYEEPRIAVVSTSTGAITSTFAIPTSGLNVNHIFYGVSIAPNGAYAYVDYYYNEIFKVNTTSKSVVATISHPNYPYGVSIAPNGAYAYVANEGNSTVSVINTSTGQIEGPITGTITGFSNPSGVSIAPNGAYAYVTNIGNDTVSIVSTSTDTKTGTITGFSQPYGVSIAPNGAYAYVTDGEYDVYVSRSCYTYSGVQHCYDNYYYYPQISVVSTSTDAYNTYYIPTSGLDDQHVFYGVSFSPNGAYAYATDYYNSTMSIINTSSLVATGTITGFHNPWGITTP